MKIEIDVPDKKVGRWEVSTFTVTKNDADMFNMRAVFQGGRFIIPGVYKKLCRDGKVIMSNTPAEIQGQKVH